MRNILALILTLICILDVSAQSAVTWADKTVWPESPQSAKIREITAPQPSLITGAAEFSVPIYSLSAEDLIIPFGLTYHSNGIKVDDEPCPYGYGWSMSPNIRISRRILGRPDGFFTSIAEIEPSRMNHLMCYHCMTDSCLQISAMTKMPDFYLDYAPDIYTVQLADKQFSFIYVDGKFVTAFCDEYKIEADDLLMSFKVTDPQGYVYNFDVTGEFSQASQYVHEWFPSSITCPSGRQITFGYIECERHVNNMQSFTPRCYTIEIRNPSDLPGIFQVKSSSTVSYTHPDYNGGKHLAFVKFEDESVNIDYDSVPSNSFLKEIKVKFGNTTVRDFKFVYTDYNLLTSIQTPAGIYSFEYDPHTFRQGGCRDWWGFANGGYNRSQLCPNMKVDEKVMNESISFEEGSDRSISAEDMQAKILKKAVFPTGGYVEWEYEPHRFDMPWKDVDFSYMVENYTDLTEGGGLRVTKITLHESQADTHPRVIKYNYGPDNNGKAVCNYVPTIETFLDVRDDMSFYPTDYVTTFGHPRTHRQLTMLPTSKYLDNCIGESPIWYEQVEEVTAEGKTVYRFEDLMGKDSFVGLNPLVSAPENLYHAFSGGIQMTEKITYEGTENAYRKISTETIQYDPLLSHLAHGFSIGRKLNYVGGSNGSDFSGWLKFDLDNGVGHPDYGGPAVVTFTEGEVYSVRQFAIAVQREVLSSKTTTEHLENGDYSVTESYDYVPGTGLVSNTTTSVQGDRISTTYTYPSASIPGVQQAMAARNMVGVAIGERTTHGSASVSKDAAMILVGNVFRPVHINERRGNGPYAYTPTYTWNNYGSLISKNDNSGVRTTYVWDQTSRYPFAMTVGGLTSRAEWNKGNGVSALISPDGVRTEYSYDSAGRLTRTAINGYGTIQTYAYIISQTGSNYVQQTDYRSATGSQNPFTITNYDGLGRPTTAVSAAFGANGATGWTYAGSATSYDGMGRPVQSYAVAPVTSPRALVNDVAASAKTFYADENPFSVTFYEPSQRGLATSQMKPGEAWHRNSKKVTTRRLTNTTQLPIPGPYLTASGGIGISGCRPGSLLIEETIDEDGITEATYTDFRGKCVLRRRGDTSTYYVYNDYGDLCHILPPGLTPRPMEADDEDLLKLGYSYTYDERGRLATSRWPGRPASQYRYDNANRLVAENDADLGDRWCLHFYDSAGREAFVAETATHPDDITGIYVARQATLSTGGTYAGYSLPITLPDDTEVIYANYYDDYTFLSLTDEPDSYKFELPEGFSDTYRTTPAGRQTGCYTSAGYEAVYYDKLGREIQRCGTGYGSGRTSYRYNYAGQIIEERQDFPADFNLPTRITTTDYDGIGNPVTVKVSMSTAEASMTYSYDAIGRLTGSILGDKVSRSFKYDVHGWPTSLVTRFNNSLVIKDRASITIPQFQQSISEQLQYADGANPRYNGFISSRTIPDGQFDYSYDELGRLTSAAFTAPTGSSADFSTEYNYDERGNILSLKRYGVVDKSPLLVSGESYGLLDDLTASYNGNFLTSVTAGTTDATTFSGRAGSGLSNRSADLRWDDAGRLKYDEARSIVDIRYNTMGLPVSMRHSSGDLQTTTYDGLGRKMAVDYLTVRTNQTQRREYYSGGLVVCNDTVETIRFAGGYFDRDLNPYYYATDYQGNNIAVFNADGRRVQDVWYYPYGEPLRRPTASFSHSSSNRYLYGDKEYANYGGESEYDFGARTFSMSVIPMATRHDPLTEERPWESPFITMAGNPVMNIDPTGMDAILIVFPDYEIKYGKHHIDFVGHAGVLLINNETGLTKYYEYGRYETSDGTSGKVKNTTIPNVKLDSKGKPTKKSLNKVLKTLSEKVGKNGRINGAYIISNEFKAMNDYAKSKLNESNPGNPEYNKDRKSYNILFNNCGTFAKDVINQDPSVDAPLILNTAPINIVEEYQEEGNAKVTYTPSTNTTIIEEGDEEDAKR